MKLGGSALAQVLNKLGDEVPTIKDSEYFADAFNAYQEPSKKVWFSPDTTFQPVV